MVVSLIPGWCKLSVCRIFTSRLWEKHVRKVVSGFRKIVVLVLMWERQEAHVCHDRHKVTLAVKVALNPNTTNQQATFQCCLNVQYFLEWVKKLVGLGENAGYFNSFKKGLYPRVVNMLALWSKELTNVVWNRCILFFHRFLYFKINSWKVRDEAWDRHDTDHCPGDFCPRFRIIMKKKLPYSPCFTATEDEVNLECHSELFPKQALVFTCLL